MRHWAKLPAMNHSPGLSRAAVHVAELQAVSKPPYRADPPGGVAPEEPLDRVLLTLVSGCEHDQVGRDRLAGFRSGAFGGEAVQLVVLDQPDRPRGNEIGASDVEIVAAPAREILELPSGSVGTEIEPESAAARGRRAAACPALATSLVNPTWAFRASGTGIDAARRSQSSSRSFAIERVGQLRARLDVHHQGRASLDQGDLGTARMQVLGDVVAAVAGSDDDRSLSGPVVAVAIFGGMQHAPRECLQRGNGSDEPECR